jgi:hypothetical protein
MKDLTNATIQCSTNIFVTLMLHCVIVMPFTAY